MTTTLYNDYDEEKELKILEKFLNLSSDSHKSLAMTKKKSFLDGPDKFLYPDSDCISLKNDLDRLTSLQNTNHTCKTFKSSNEEKKISFINTYTSIQATDKSVKKLTDIDDLLKPPVENDLSVKIPYKCRIVKAYESPYNQRYNDYYKHYDYKHYDYKHDNYKTISKKKTYIYDRLNHDSYINDPVPDIPSHLNPLTPAQRLSSALQNSNHWSLNYDELIPGTGVYDEIKNDTTAYHESKSSNRTYHESKSSNWTYHDSKQSTSPYHESKSSNWEYYDSKSSTSLYHKSNISRMHHLHLTEKCIPCIFFASGKCAFDNKCGACHHIKHKKNLLLYKT